MFEPHCWATLLPPDQFSFPSGHTITAFAVAVSLSRFYPDLAIGLLFCAVSVAASRILLGMHFLSDVLAGAAIGSLLAFRLTIVSYVVKASRPVQPSIARPLLMMAFRPRNLYENRDPSEPRP